MPMRTCIISREKKEQEDLIQVSFFNGELFLGNEKTKGRSVYLKKEKEVLVKFLKRPKEFLEAFLKRKISKEQFEKLKEELSSQNI